MNLRIRRPYATLSHLVKKIISNQQESNVTSINTCKYPNGTETPEETKEALELHFKEPFTENDEWFNDIKNISDTTKELLEKPITKNNLTNVIFKEMGSGKSPGADVLTVKFYMKF
jgi:hypothetical protein